jgi:hypothetical protein
VPCIVKVEQQFSFEFLDKWVIFISFFLDYQITTLSLLRRGGGVAITAIAYNYLTPEERRHIVKLGVSIRVHGQRERGLNLLVSHVWLGIETR